VPAGKVFEKMKAVTTLVPPDVLVLPCVTEAESQGDGAPP